MGNSNISKQKERMNQSQLVVKNNSSPGKQINSVCKQQLFGGKYVVLSNFTDESMGNCMLLKNSCGGGQFIAKKVYFGCSQQYRVQVERLLKIKGIYQKHQQVLQIIDVIYQKDYQNYQGQLELNYVTQCFGSPLKTVFYKRMAQNKAFNQYQIIQLIINSVTGYSIIQSSGSKNSKVRMQTISVREIGEGEDSHLSFQVFDDHLTELDTNYQLNKKSSLFTLENQTVFLSPEQFIAFVSHSKETIVDQKSGVFSLGATILSLCLMQPVKFIYNNISKFIDGRLLMSLIKIASQRYGSFVGQMLCAMLQLNEQRRPKFGNLFAFMQTKLSEYKKINILLEEPTEHTLSLLQSQDIQLKMNRSTCSSELDYIPQCRFSKFSSIDWEKLIFEEQIDSKSKLLSKDQNLNLPSLRPSNTSEKIIKQPLLFETEQNYIYEGQLENGQPNGWGILYCCNSPNLLTLFPTSWPKTLLPEVQNELIEKYEGQFKQGVFWGVGRVYCKSGVAFEGLFVNGKVKYQSGQGKIVKLQKKCTLQQ